MMLLLLRGCCAFLVDSGTLSAQGTSSCWPLHGRAEAVSLVRVGEIEEKVGRMREHTIFASGIPVLALENMSELALWR